MNQTNSIIETKIVKLEKSDFHLKRMAMSIEAQYFMEGTYEKQQMKILTVLPNGKEVYFLRPSDKYLRLEPHIGLNGISETDGWGFQKIWEYLIKISIINQITFKKVLVLLYRNCFLLDHTDIGSGKIRYSPSEDLQHYINSINDYALVDGFKDKFNSTELGLLEFLYFVDILAWNEDIKYNSKIAQDNSQEINVKGGRINTILSLISAPIMISKFISDIIYKTDVKGAIDVHLVTSTIQTFLTSGGYFSLTNKDLLENLSPYLIP